MKVLLGLILALAGAGFLMFNSPANLESSNPLYQEYAQWKQTYGKAYNGEIDTVRFGIWLENWMFVQTFEHPTQTVAMNAFADMSNEEFSAQYLMKIDPTQEQQYLEQEEPRQVEAVPSSVDWVAKGAVTPVENQGSCGSCWAFSTKESLEGIYQIKTGNLEVLSAQQLTDCSTASFGCQGGYQMSTYTYTKSKGIQSNASYPYVSGNTGRATSCTYNQSKVVFKNTGGKMVSPRNNQQAIQQAVVQQPLSVLVAASGISFQLYNGGILSSCGTSTDHAILLTGYNTSGSSPYYVVKNSWGTTWGEKGYAKIAMTGNGAGVCGIQTSVAYPTY